MTGLLVAWLSTTPPYFATRLYWSAVTLLITGGVRFLQYANLYTTATTRY